MESREHSLFKSYLSLFIILEPDDAAEYEELADMVKEVNSTQVDVGERLSDHVYVYNRSEEVLKVAA